MEGDRRRNRNALVGAAGICLVAGVAGAWFFAQRDATPDGPWIRFVRSGGFTGETDALTLEEDGTAVVNGRRFQASRDDLQQVSAALEDVDWGDPPRYSADCRDCVYYELRHGGYFVRMNHESDQPGYDALVASLVDIISAAPGRRP